MNLETQNSINSQHLILDLRFNSDNGSTNLAMNSNVTVFSCITIPNLVTQSITLSYNQTDASNYNQSNNNYDNNFS